MTYEEVVKAMAEGKQLQVCAYDDYPDVTYEQAQNIAPCSLRIKPEEPKERLEVWANIPRWRTVAEQDSVAVFKRPNADNSRLLREVHPGDLTREEVLEKIEEYERLGSVNVKLPTIRRIFGVEDE